MSSRTIIYDYLKQNKFMALATAGIDNKPEVATVEYVLDGETLLINTFMHYRKYTNLISNPQVACVVTTGEEITLQFDASIEQLEGAEAEVAKQRMLKVEPDFADFFNDVTTRFFRVTPTWMRLRDYTKQPLEVTEYIPVQ